MTTENEHEAAIVGLADGDDLFATIPVDDLRALLEVATTQVDAVDDDEAEAYGLTRADCARLWQAGRSLLESLPARAE